MRLSPTIFWDVDQDKIDFNKRKRFVIARAIKYGTISDWNTVKRYYGLDVIKQEMIDEVDLDSRSLSFLSCILGVPKEKFKCYTRKQFRLQHSSF